MDSAQSETCDGRFVLVCLRCFHQRTSPACFSFDRLRQRGNAMGYLDNFQRFQHKVQRTTLIFLVTVTIFLSLFCQ